MFQKVLSISRKVAISLMACVAFSVAFVAPAHAALPAPVQAAYDGVGTLVTDHETAAWVIVLTITVALIGISLFKKFIRKSAS